MKSKSNQIYSKWALKVLHALPALGIVSTSATLGACQEKTEEKPNILFLLVDDMQADAIASLGNQNVHTPNIDRLMNQGVTFNHCYTNGALCGALSMPSRAMLMTGRGLFQIQSDGMKIPETLTTWPEHFRSHGYRTFGTGKWHSDMASFNRSFAEGDNIFFGGMHRYETNGHASPQLNHYDETGKYENVFVGEKFSSEMFADAAQSFLSTTTHDDTPFLAFVSFTSPHDPRNQSPEYGVKCRPDDVVLPANFLPQHPFDNGELDIRDELVLPPPRDPMRMKEELALYYNMVNEVDIQIGRVLDALKKTGKLDNTIIVFASDNGLAMGQNGLIGKQSLYEHSIKVPMAIVAPKYKQNKRTSSALCYLYDIFPTLCDLAQIEIPESVTGKSLVKVLDGEKDTHRNEIFLAYSNQQRALLRDNYKYIIYNVEGAITEQLFDLGSDPGELNNLIEAMPQKAAEYKQSLSKTMLEQNDFCKLDDPVWWSDGNKITWNELINLYLFE